MDKQMINLMLGIMLCTFLTLRNLFAEIDYGSHIKGNETELYVDKYGEEEALIASNGYLFVEFEYIPAPYTIQRIGQAVVVNGVIVNCLFRGIPPVGQEVKNGVTENMLKQGVNYYVDYLSDLLQQRSEAVFLQKTGFQKSNLKPIADDRMSLRVPLLDMMNEKLFIQLIKKGFNNQLDSTAIKDIEKKTKRRKLTSENILLFVAKAKKDKKFIEHFRKKNKLE